MDFALDSSSSPIRGCEGITTRVLETLPAELLLKVVESLDSPLDIQSLIAASPTALALFAANRRRILRASAEKLKVQISDDALFPQALRAVRLRLLCKRYSGCTVDEIEQHIRPVLESLRSDPSSSETSPLETSWAADLPSLLATIRLLSDTEAIMTGLAEEIWGHMQDHPIYYIHGFTTRQKLPHEPLELSELERARFLNVLFRFDSYCSAFFYDEDVLFSWDGPLRKLVALDADQLGDPGKTDEAMTDFYCVLFFMGRRHEHLLKRVDNAVASLTASTTTAAKTSPDVAEPSRTLCQSALKFFRCRNRWTPRAIERSKYLDYLSAQGYPLLLHLEQLDGPALQEFTLETFRRITLSPKPAFDRDEGDDADFRGVDGIPWLFSNQYSFARHEPHMKYRSTFWDGERSIRLEERAEAQRRRSTSRRPVRR